MNDYQRKKTLTKGSKIAMLMGMMGLIFIMACCRTTQLDTKIEYLEQFQTFSNYIKEKCDSLTTENYLAVDATYLALSQDLYEEFYDQLLEKDKEQIWQYRMTYLKCRGFAHFSEIGREWYLKAEKKLLK